MLPQSNWVLSKFAVLTIAFLVTLSIPKRSSVTMPHLQNAHFVNSSHNITTSPTSAGLTVDDLKVDE